jgi:ubiquinone/menaquinone biosynthesis C-methylase UbiE/DNA-binding transcriptional ArsR family regulator
MIKTASNSASLVALMESLADRTRLRLLRLLERHELGVVELCDILQQPQSTVSRHLKILADQKWVRSRRDGTTHFYRMILDEIDPPARKLWLLAREQTDDWATVHQDDLRLLRRLRHRETDTQAFFAGAAGQWDKLRRELYGESFTTSAMLALLPSEYIVADLGCGTGQTTALLADHVKQVIGIDSSAAMLKAARKRIGDKPNVDLFRGDLASVPLEDASCDAVLLLLVLTYVPTIQPVLREAHRILKIGGKIVIVDLLLHDRDDFRRQMGQQHSGFELQQFKADLVEAGFVNVNANSLPPEANVKGPAMFLATALRNR